MPELHYTRAGSGEPLLVLHGLFGSGRNWQSHMRGMAGSFEVFCVDLRNHGQSFHADEMSYSLMAEDVLQLLTHLGMEKCRILGHSMGGKVAMALAIQNPTLLSRMVVADIAPVAYRHHYDDLIEPILALDLERFESRTEIDHALRPHIREDQLRAFLLQSLARENDNWRWRINWQVIQRDMEALTGFDVSTDEWTVDVPTLFIRGASSDYVGADEIDVIERHFSAASFATIEAAGHWLHAEQPRQFSSAVLQFLRRD